MPIKEYPVKLHRTPKELTRKAHHLELLRRIQEGDKKALETLWRENQGLVYLYVRKYARSVPVQDREDLTQFMFFYFWRGAQKYDPEKTTGMPLSYLALWVRAGISNYIAKYLGHDERMTSSTSSLSCTKDDRTQDALDRALRNQGDADDPDAEDAVEARRVETLISSLLEGLSVRDVMIARLRLFADEPATLKSVAVRCGCSRERVRQLELMLRRTIARKLLDHPEADVYGWRDRFLASALLIERSRNDFGRQAA